MEKGIFCESGHVSRWVFYPPVWNSQEPWQQGFSPDELEKIFEHMKVCHSCREAEIEATLLWAALRPRVTVKEIIKSIVNSHSCIESTVLPFDKYPPYLLQHILQYTKGQLITLHRDDSDRVTKITGTVNGTIESDCSFFHEGSKTSLFCYSHNSEDDPISESERITFADFFIDFSETFVISYSSNVTEFFPEEKKINRYHMNHKIILNAQRKVTKIFQDGEIFYEAEYDLNHNLIKEKYGKVQVEHGYAENKKTFKKITSESEIVDHLTFEYVDNYEIPVRIFKQVDSCIQLSQVNSFSNNAGDKIDVELEFDGVTRAYFDNTGEFVVKVCLPNNSSLQSINAEVTSFRDFCGKIDNIDMVLVDPKTKSMRILKKDQGVRRVDQMAKYHNGKLVKVYNHKEALYTAVQSAFFSDCKWSEEF